MAREFEKLVQIISAQLVDQQKLVVLLKKTYGVTEEGKGNFRVEVWTTQYHILIAFNTYSYDSTTIRYTLQIIPSLNS
jgi:hypothetical protein